MTRNADGAFSFTMPQGTAQVADCARQAMAWAVETGIVSGTSATTPGAKAGAARAQLAVILFRAFAQA